MAARARGGGGEEDCWGCERRGERRLVYAFVGDAGGEREEVGEKEGKGGVGWGGCMRGTGADIRVVRAYTGVVQRRIYALSMVAYTRRIRGCMRYPRSRICVVHEDIGVQRQKRKHTLRILLRLTLLSHLQPKSHI